ncbi:super-infection exclusion protein B [Planctomycetota bacterium]
MRVHKTIFKALMWSTLPVAISSAVLLFLPKEYLVRMEVELFAETYRPVLGLALIIAGSCAVVYLFSLFVDHLANLSAKKARQRKKRIAVLEELTPEQRGYLAQYLEGATNIDFMLVDVVASTLRQRDIIYISGQRVGMVNAPHQLRKWARRQLKKRPELLENAKLSPDRVSDETYTVPSERTRLSV